MERKIGEVFEFHGEWYQCVKGYLCEDCAFSNTSECEDKINNGLGDCYGRIDRDNVIYWKLVKVGEPFTSNGSVRQLYRSNRGFTNVSLPEGVTIVRWDTIEVIVKSPDPVYLSPSDTVVETAAQLIDCMKQELNKLSSWYVPVVVDGKKVTSVELDSTSGKIFLSIKTL